MKFLGYPRPDGSAGIRNYVLVIPGGLVAAKICDFVVGTRSETINHAEPVKIYTREPVF